MSDQPWDRREGEPNRWFQRFERFRLAGPGRTLSGCANAERVERGRKESKDASGKWREIAKAWDWVGRAEAWDTYLSDRAAAAAEAKRMEVLAEGFGLDYERVRTLKELAAQLKQWFGEEDRIWLPDVKSIGSGDAAERVDIIRFNAPLIEQLRGVLSDIADEVGGRQKTSRNLNVDLSGLSDEELEQIAAGKDPIKVISSHRGEHDRPGE